MLRSPLAALCLSTTPALAQVVGPDIVTLRVGETLGGADAIAHYAGVAGEDAYAFSTTACNLGDTPIAWNGSTHDHPVIA